MSDRHICCVVGCDNSYSKTKNIRFFSFPSEKKDAPRRQKWIQAVKRIRPDGKPWMPNVHSKVCSDHFVSKAPVYHPNHPDYIPSVFPSVYKKNLTQDPSSRLHRNIRAVRRQERRFSAVTKIGSVLERLDSPSAMDSVSDVSDPVYSMVQSCEVAVQTDSTEHSRPSTSFVFTCTCFEDGIATEATIPTEGLVKPMLVSTLSGYDKPAVRSALVGPDKRTCFFAGYESIRGSPSACEDLCGVKLNVFSLLLFLLSDDPNAQGTKVYLGMEDKLVLFLMKIKSGLTFNALSALFSVHASTASRIFYKVLYYLSSKTANWIHWQSRKVIDSAMPLCFKANFPNCRVIIDCFEVRTETPSLNYNQNCMYSTYKSGYTAKFLIGISPAGCITFISEGYGGRSSDGAVTIDCGVLKLLDSGDVVMADRGFPKIRTQCENAGVVVVMPPRASENPQFSVEEMEETVEIASVRIHVERMIQRVRLFNILNVRVPTELICHMHKIVHFCCVLANLQAPIIKRK